MTMQNPATPSSASEDPPVVDADLSTVWKKIDNMVDGFMAQLPALAIAIVVFAVIAVASGFVKRGIMRVTKDRPSKSVGVVLGRLAQWVVLFVGLLIAVAIAAPSVKPADLLAGLGIGGVAIGFAFKDILQNFLAGILLLLRQPFEVGDTIAFAGHTGTVESIETRSTFVRGFDGQRIVIPNGELFTNSVVVKNRVDRRRSTVTVGIGYGDDLRRAQQIVLDTVRGIDGVLGEPSPEVRFTDLGDSSVNLRARWWIDPSESSQSKVESDVVAAIKLALDDAGIDMPFPTRVHLNHEQTQASQQPVARESQSA